MSKTTDTVARTLYKQARERQANPRDVWGIPWGINGLDSMTGGIQPEEITVLGADSGVGKSALAGQVALNVTRWVQANRPGHVIRIVHTEMSAEAFLKRLACIKARVRSKRINTGRATPTEMEAYTKALKELAEMPIEIEDEPQSLEDTIRFIRGRTPDDLPCAWWMLDYLQEHPGRENSSADGVNKVAEVMPALRNVAKRVAPGMVTSQFTKSISDRAQQAKQQTKGVDDVDATHRPQSGDLLGGRTILAVANVILLLYRPDFYKDIPDERKDREQYSELIVSKNRDGDLGKVKMFFSPPFAEYTDASVFEGSI